MKMWGKKWNIYASIDISFWIRVTVSSLTIQCHSGKYYNVMQIIRTGCSSLCISKGRSRRCRTEPLCVGVLFPLNLSKCFFIHWSEAVRGFKQARHRPVYFYKLNFFFSLFLLLKYGFNCSVHDNIFSL